MTYFLRFLKFCGILSVIALAVIFFQFNVFAMNFADSLRAGTGWMAFLALCALEAAGFALLFLSWYPRRSKLVLHASPTREQLDAFSAEMAKRLRGNELVRQAGISPDQPDFVPKALEALDAKAEEIIRQDSRRIFLGTALSQNGRLDAVIVFVALTRMVWRVSKIYNQRPTPAEIWSVYSTVSSSAFIAFSIDALDIPRTVTEAMNALLPAVGPHVAGTTMPFMGSAMTVFTSSMLDGAANGLLAVRCGILTKNAFRYASLDEGPQRAATVREINMAMLALSKDCVADIVVGLRNQFKDMTVGAAQSVASAVTGTVGAAGDAVVSGVTAAGGAAVSAGKAVADGVGAVGDAAVNAGKAVGGAAVSAARTVASGVEAAGGAAVSAGKAVAGGVGAVFGRLMPGRKKSRRE